MPDAANPPAVTIVVPIYGDLPTLTSCIESLKHTVDLERNCVLLVNDCGPDADIIEASLLAQIKGWGSIRYERNERNLGFVGTCNRAVTELDTSDNDILLLNSDTVTTPGFLDELSAVLHLSPLHGIVCARSNNATIASFPFWLRDPSDGRGIARAAEVHAALSGAIHRYSVSPVAPGFCLLIRRELITRHGLFDDAFAPGYLEEYDFCLRMNEFGYSSIIANRAMVYHVGARSFAGAINSLLSSHGKLFAQRYPFFERAIRAYLLFDRDPVDVFADVLVPADDVRRVLVDIDTLSTVDLPDNIRALLAALREASDPNRLVVGLSIPDGQRDTVAARYPTLQVIGHSRSGGLWDVGLWDVAVVSADTVSPRQLIRINQLSPRWVFTSTGISGVRNWRKRAANSSIKTPMQDAIGHADGIIALRTDVSAEFESYAVSAMLHFPAGCIVEVKGCDVNRIVQEIVERFGRSVIDIKRLRARWDYFPSYQRYETESLIRRLIRWAERAAPRPIGYAKTIVRKLR